MARTTQHKHRSGCPIACGLDVVGDHWTLLIVRNLMFLGVHEYKDMLQQEERISSSILSSRLKNLQRDGLVAAVAHPDSRRRKLYYLTARGKDLIYLVTELIVWSNRYLGEWLDIPEPKRHLIENDPDQLIRLALQELDDWEKEYVG